MRQCKDVPDGHRLSHWVSNVGSNQGDTKGEAREYCSGLRLSENYQSLTFQCNFSGRGGPLLQKLSQLHLGRCLTRQRLTET